MTIIYISNSSCISLTSREKKYEEDEEEEKSLTSFKTDPSELLANLIRVRNE